MSPGTVAPASTPWRPDRRTRVDEAPQPGGPYSSHQLAAAAGIGYQRLHYWCAAGIFGPDQQNLGSGTRRRFTEEDLAVAKVLRVMGEVTTGHGVAWGVALEVADLVRAGARYIHVDECGAFAPSTCRAVCYMVVDVEAVLDD